ncbi:MAG TPA: MlaD family protein [Methylomirabilota bacterium]|nr:MlaD family protein [Methylomirabilota bacterium]
MRNTLETRLGLFFALALVAAFIILEMIGSRSFFKAGFPVKARFTNVQELKKGDPVKMAGVDIGRVEDVELGDNRVVVTLKINKDAKVKTDSKASIRFTGLLGQNFVAVDFGTPGAPVVTAGSEIETVEQADLNTLMTKIEAVASGVEGLTKNFSGENFSNLLGPFTDFLRENSPRLAAILGNMQVISGQIAKGEGTVGKLIMDEQLYTAALTTVTNLNSTATDLQKLLGDAEGLVADAKLTLGSARETMAGVQQGQGTIGKLLKDETLYRETTTAMVNLREILQKINQGQGSVGKLVNDQSFFDNAKLTLQKVEKATEGLEDQGPLSVLGMAVNSLF